MRAAPAYAVLAVAGAVVPLAAFLPWLGVHGADLGQFGRDLFANRVSSFFGLDVILSALSLFAFIGWEGRRLGIGRLWLPIVATLMAGVSCGLPLFLWQRARVLESR